MTPWYGLFAAICGGIKWLLLSAGSGGSGCETELLFVSSAANEERTDDMMYWEEVEAASRSATSAAMSAADFLDPDFVVAAGGGDVAEVGFRSAT